MKRFSKNEADNDVFEVDFSEFLTKRGQTIDSVLCEVDFEINVLRTSFLGGLVKLTIGGGAGGRIYSGTLDISTIPSGLVKRELLQFRVTGASLRDGVIDGGAVVVNGMPNDEILDGGTP